MDTRSAVHDLLHRYCRLADQGRLSEIVGLFTDDGVFEIGGERCQGPVAIEAVLMQLGERFGATDVGRSLRHHLTTVTVGPVGSGDGAGGSTVGSVVRVRAYVLVVGRDGLDHWGHYRDYLVDGPDGWRIAHRRAITDGACPGSVVEHLVGRQ